MGSSPSSLAGVPIGDPDWEIWACGPGAHLAPEFKARFDVWFELHNMADNDPQYGTVIDHKYFEWLQEIADEKTVFYRPPLYPGLKGELIPWDDISSKHSGFFLDSTIAWMMAYAYECCEVEKIGIWGIDFATDEERRKQKKGAKHFIELFRLKGIECVIPDTSDMIYDPPPYPDESRMYKKFSQHMNLLIPQQEECDKQIAELKNALAQRELHRERIRGTMQTLEHFRENMG